MKLKFVLGWILVFIGLGIILWVLFYCYQILTLKKEAPLIFKQNDILNKNILKVEEKIVKTDYQQQIQKQIENVISSKLDEVLSPQIIIKFLNLIALSIFAGIFILGGGKIAFIGVELLRNNKNDFKF